MKSGDFVFYSCNGTPHIGKLGYKKDKEKWVIIPLQRSSERVLRKKEKIVPVKKLIKHIDIYKKI